jgi:hypothetical protein
MANGRDTLRLVTLSTGGRPVEVLDLNDANQYWRDRDAGFTYTPPPATQQVARTGRRYGGGRVVGESHDNATVAWTAYVRGTTVTSAAQRVEQLLDEINDAARGRYVEWAPDGLSSSFMEIAGPGTWLAVYDPLQLSQAFGMRVQITFPVLPLVRWAPMTIGDDFSVNSLSDYTFDSLASSDVSVSSGNLYAAGGSLTSERRVRHTARGYDLLEGQATVKSTPSTTITGYKIGVILRARDASNYVEVYVDDNGTNSRLRIDVVQAGSRTNRASTNLAARLSSGTAAWVRGRIVGGTITSPSPVVTAEYFTSAPTPTGTPTLTASYTLVGGDGLLTSSAGKAGWSWVPQNSAASTVDDFEFRPFTYRNLTLPQLIAPADTIPGTAPALAEAVVSPSGGASPPAWPLLAWTKVRDPAATSRLFGIYEAESASFFNGTWVVSAQAGARGGNELRSSTGSVDASYAEFSFAAANTLEPDDFTDEQISIEVWARVIVSAGLVDPRITAYIAVTTSVGVAGSQPTIEFGTTGKRLTVPSSGTVYRFVRLGTIMIDAVTSSAPKLLLFYTTESGSAAVPHGVDYVMTVPARRRACGATGVQAGTTQSFAPTVDPWIKRVRADLSTTAQEPGGSAFRTAGVGGSLIQPSPGPNRWLVKLSSLVPDDPSSDATSEQLAHNATVSLDVTPRSHLLRNA